MFLFFAMLASFSFLKQKKSSLVTGVGSIKNQHEGGGGGPLSKIEVAIENVDFELLSVVRRINDFEQKKALTAKEDALLELLRTEKVQLRKKEEQLRKKEEQLRTETELLLKKDLILLERGQHSGPVQSCVCRN
jgi:hypothetical protein